MQLYSSLSKNIPMAKFWGVTHCSSDDTSTSPFVLSSPSEKCCVWCIVITDTLPEYCNRLPISRVNTQPSASARVHSRQHARICVHTPASESRLVTSARSRWREHASTQGRKPLLRVSTQIIALTHKLLRQHASHCIRTQIIALTRKLWGVTLLPPFKKFRPRNLTWPRER